MREWTGFWMSVCEEVLQSCDRAMGRFLELALHCSFLWDFFFFFRHGFTLLIVVIIVCAYFFVKDFVRNYADCGWKNIICGFPPEPDKFIFFLWK